MHGSAAYARYERHKWSSVRNLEGSDAFVSHFMYSVLSSISISDQRSRGAIAIPDPTAIPIGDSAWGRAAASRVRIGPISPRCADDGGRALGPLRSALTCGARASDRAKHAALTGSVLGGGWTDRRRPCAMVPPAVTAAAGAGPSMSILLLLFRAGRYVCVSAGPVFVRLAGMAN
jgi:hypothetical protein